MASSEREQLLDREIVVEEKVDGANLGLSFDSNGKIVAQNRGTVLRGQLRGQWSRLRGWLAAHAADIQQHIPAGAILFGEWCYARHSISYANLPDWFLAFDILAAADDTFVSTATRDRLLAATGLATIRRIASGKFSLSELTAMLDVPSAYYSGPIEGLYIRAQDGVYLHSRAKLVRPDFTQHISEHWSDGPLVANRLAAQNQSEQDR